MKAMTCTYVQDQPLLIVPLHRYKSRGWIPPHRRVFPEPMVSYPHETLAHHAARAAWMAARETYRNA